MNFCDFLDAFFFFFFFFFAQQARSEKGIILKGKIDPNLALWSISE